MEAERRSLARGEQVPGPYARYRFYVRGRVPPGYEEWARRRLDLPHFIVVYLVLELVVWGLATAAVFVATGGRTFPTGLWAIGAALALISPFSALFNRNKARRSLRDPPAREVLKDIGEPLPPRP